MTFLPHPPVITSDANPRFRQLAELLTAKGIKKHGLGLLAGKKQVEEALALHAGSATLLVSRGTDAALPAAAAGLRDLERLALAPPLFDQLDAAGTRQPLLVVRLRAIPEFAADAPWPAGCTLFVGFQNPDNVGAVIRTAAAFGVPRIVLLREAAHPYLPKGSRAAGPALLSAPLAYGPSITELADRPVPHPLIALDAGAPELDAEPWPAAFGLLAGLEGPGLPAALRHGPRRGISMEPGQESLNAATAIAIALYSWRRTRNHEL